MCDLWQHTTERDTPAERSPRRSPTRDRHSTARTSRSARSSCTTPAASSIPALCPTTTTMASPPRSLASSRVIVESHPALVGARTRRFLEALHRHQAADVVASARSRDGARDGTSRGARAAEQEDDGRRFLLAAGRLRSLGVALRVFLLVSPPFVPTDEQDEWLLRSIDRGVRSRRDGRVAHSDATGKRRARRARRERPLPAALDCSISSGASTLALARVGSGRRPACLPISGIWSGSPIVGTA